MIIPDEFFEAVKDEGETHARQNEGEHNHDDNNVLGVQGHGFVGLEANRINPG